jgi:hypothetical protein
MKRYCRYFEDALREAQANGEIQIDHPRVKARELYAYLIGSMVQARIRNDTGILRQLSAGVWPILRWPTAAAPKAPKFSPRRHSRQLKVS